MMIEASVVEINRAYPFTEKMIKLAVTLVDKDGYPYEEECYITKDMLLEVLGLDQ